MADVLSPVVAAYVFEAVGGWLSSNAGVASALLLAIAGALLWWRASSH